MRARTLVLSAAVFAASLALPATLVGAQEPATTTSTEPASNEVTTAPSAEQIPSAQGVPATGEDAGSSGAASGTQSEGGSPSLAASSTVAASSKAAAKGSASVSILDGNSTDEYQFSPASITISAGDTVTWTNNGSVPEGHDVKGSGFESGTLQAGQTYSHTFSSAGTFPYICSIHPFMKGTVTVQGTGGSGGGGGGGGNGSGGAPDTNTKGTTPSGTSPTTGAGSESAAGTSPDAAGTSTQLPSTGLPLLPMLGLGGGLVALGLLLRRRPRRVS